MPITIPTPQRQESESQLPNVQDQVLSSPETFGGGAGLEAVDAVSQRVSKSGADIAIFEKIKADQIAVADATSQGSEAYLDILHNQKDGILNMQGKNAMNAPTIARDKFQKSMSAIANDLHTDDQRGMFARVQQNLGKELDRTVQAHVSKQIEAYDTQTLNSLLKTTTNAAALSYGDITTVGTNIQRQKVAIQQYGERHGKDDLWIEDQTNNAVSATHGEVIKQMIDDGQFTMATQYMTANKDDIDAKVRDQLRPILKEGTVRGEAQQNADKFWDSADGDFSKAMDKARTIDNPDVRQRTEQEIRSRQEDQQRGIRASQDNAFQDGWKKVVQSGSQDPAAVEAMITPSEKVAMGSEHFKALLRANADEPTDPDAWAKWEMVARDPDTLAKLSPSEVQVMTKDFSKQDRSKANSRYEAASRGIDKTEIPAKQFDIAAAQVIPGYKPSKLRGDSAIAAKSLHDDITSEMLDWQKTTGKQANPEERQKIIDKVIANRTFNQPTWFGLSSEKRLVRNDIPQKAIDGIAQLRTAKGLPLTKSQAERYYDARVSGDNSGAAAILKE